MSSSDVVPLGLWDQATRRARRRADLEQLRAQPSLIAQRSELEACHVIKQLGVEDAAPLLAYVTPDQTRALLDLEVWSVEGLRPADVLSWLAGYREAGLEALAGAVRAWDPEAAAAFLDRRLHVALKPTDDTPPEEIPDWLRQADDDLEILTTPDDRMLVAARRVDPTDDEPVDEDEREAVLRLVADLYRDEGWEETAGLLRMALTDDRLDLEETARRFRTARLEDFGFPSPERAQAIYAPRDVEPAVARDALQPTAVALVGAYVPEDDVGLFAAALRRLADPGVVQRIESELVPLANAVLTADRLPWSDPEAIVQAVGKVVGFVQVGLGPDDAVDAAAARLSAQPLRVWFELGHTRAARIAQRLRRLAAGGAFALGDDPWALLEAPERDAAEALVHPRRAFPEVLNPRGAASDGAREALGREPLGVEKIGVYRAWSSAADVEAADALAVHLEAWAEAEAALGLAAGLQRLDGDLWPAEPQERTLRVGLTTALTRAWLGGAFRPEPLAREELRELAGLLPLPPDAPAHARDDLQLAGTEAVLSALAQQVPPRAAEAVRREAAWGLARATASLAPFAGRDPDPRFVEGLLVRFDSRDEEA